MTKLKRDGVLLMYQCPRAMMLRRDELEAIATKHGLDLSILPKESSGPDKFRKAFRHVLSQPEWRSVQDKQGRQVKLSPTTVVNNKSTLQMDLMQQVIQGSQDAAGFMENPVEHSVFKMFFHKDMGSGGKDSITFQVPVDGNGNHDLSSWVEGVDYHKLVKQVIDQQDAYVNEIDGGAVGELMKNYTRRMNGRPFRRFRGIHYVPEQQVDHAERFRDAMREWSDGQIDITLVPQFDAFMSEMREFFEEGMLDEIKQIFEEIDPRGEMQDRKFARIERHLKDMAEVAKIYDGKVDKTRIEAALSACMGQFELSKEANKVRKEEAEARRIREKEERKSAMRAKKSKPMAEEDRLSVL